MAPLKKEKSMRKLFELSEQEVALLDRVKKEQELGSEVAALRYILCRYQEQEDQKELIKEAIQTYEAEAKGFHERLKWSSTMAERNTTMLLDVANTFLFQQGIEDCIPVEDIESPVLARSRDILKRKLAHFKQQKDNRRKG